MAYQNVAYHPDMPIDVAFNYWQHNTLVVPNAHRETFRSNALQVAQQLDSRVKEDQQKLDQLNQHKQDSNDPAEKQALQDRIDRLEKRKSLNRKRFIKMEDMPDLTPTVADERSTFPSLETEIAALDSKLMESVKKENVEEADQFLEQMKQVYSKMDAIQHQVDAYSKMFEDPPLDEKNDAGAAPPEDEPDEDGPGLD